MMKEPRRLLPMFLSKTKRSHPASGDILVVLGIQFKIHTPNNNHDYYYSLIVTFFGISEHCHTKGN